MSRKRPEDSVPDDAAIRRLYESVATERTPPSLDAAVLSAARQVSRDQRRWIQPIALAASTLLCLGLVIELVSEPEPANSIVAPAESGTAAVHRAAIESRAQKLGELQRGKAGTPFDNDTPLASPVPDGRAEPPACSPEDRADPVEWLNCIEALESIGDSEQAALERASLLREHPAFDDGTE